MSWCALVKPLSCLWAQGAEPVPDLLRRGAMAVAADRYGTIPCVVQAAADNRNGQGWDTPNPGRESDQLSEGTPPTQVGALR